MPRDQHVINPGTIIVTLVLMGISALFAGTCAAYVYMMISDRLDAPLPPLLFFINIVVLFGATFLLRRSRHAFQRNRWGVFGIMLWSCAGLTCVFAVLQILGWLEFFKHVPLTASQARSFLFILSALHLAHVLAGIPFLLWFIWKTRVWPVDEISKYKRFQYLHGLCRYWNFLDVLWILLVIILTAAFSMRWL